MYLSIWKSRTQVSGKFKQDHNSKNLKTTKSYRVISTGIYEFGFNKEHQQHHHKLGLTILWRTWTRIYPLPVDGCIHTEQQEHHNPQRTSPRTLNCTKKTPKSTNNIRKNFRMYKKNTPDIKVHQNLPLDANLQSTATRTSESTTNIENNIRIYT